MLEPKKNRAIARVVLGAAPWALLAACASTPPSEELLAARSAYQRASDSAAAKYTPDRLLTAKQALQQAERQHKEKPRSDAASTFAYVAERGALEAMAYGGEAKARAQVSKTDAEYKKLAQRAGDAFEEQQVQRELAMTSQAQQELQLRLEQEKRARAEAEAALADLKSVGSVKEQERGTVITLPGGVLFKPGSATLLPAAQNDLMKVASALGKLGGDRMIVIEGHTDARGSNALNERLSQSRADAVRAFLVQQGIAAEKLQAVGKGELHPVASNDSTEGRAINRRVEIVVPSEPAPESP